MKEISHSQRRARLARRHFLSQPADDPATVTKGLVSIHSSDPATVYLTMWARVRDFGVEHLEELLYEERTLVRHWAMRRTLWVIDRQTLPHAVAASTNAIGEKERRRTAKLIENGGVADDGEAWLQEMIPKTLDAIRGHGEVLTGQLSRDIPELAEKITFHNKAGKVMGTTGMASRVLLQLGMESRVIRARPTGSWLSGQYRWAEIEEWLGGSIEDFPAREASAQLIEAWLRSYGPATERDVRWWSGWPVSQVRAALRDIEAVEVDLGEDGTGYLLPADLEPVSEPDPWVAFLPSLDTTAMGWKDRDWYLGQYGERVFDRNGNAGPTVWLDGRVVGGWAQRDDGEVVYDLFEDVDAGARGLIESRREKLQNWLDDVIVTPRFRSPHHRELTST